MEMFYIGECPICKGYGRLKIAKDITADKCFVICEECLAEWETPQDAMKNIGGQRGKKHLQTRNAAVDEIKSLGWDKFVLSADA